jgi:hypothetical protein
MQTQMTPSELGITPDTDAVARAVKLKVGDQLHWLIKSRNDYAKSWWLCGAVTIGYQPAGYIMGVITKTICGDKAYRTHHNAISISGYSEADFQAMCEDINHVVKESRFARLNPEVTARGIISWIEQLSNDYCDPHKHCGLSHEAIAQTFPLGSDESHYFNVTNWNPTKNHFARRILRKVLTPDDIATSPRTVTCEVCKHRVSPNALACPSCGEPFKVTSTESPPKHDGSSNVFINETLRMLTKWFWRGGWKFVLFLSLLAFLYFRHTLR